MIESPEQGLITIMKTFHPVELKNNIITIYLTLFSIIQTTEKNSFSINEIIDRIKKNDTKFDKPSENKVIWILDKLEKKDLIQKGSDQRYQLSSLSITAINEFFPFSFEPRKGKSGFENFLRNKDERIIQWSCLFKAPEQFTSEVIEQLSGIDAKNCTAYLDRLYRKNQLERKGKKYNLTKAGEERVFKKLLREYRRYCFTKPQIIDYIMELLCTHGKMSGKEIVEHLKSQGKDFDRTTVYKNLKSLESCNAVIVADRVKRRAIEEVYYEPIYEGVEIMKEQILSDIKELFQKVGINVRVEFFEKAKEQQPHVLNIFRMQLFTFVSLDAHYNSTCNLWENFRENLLEKGFPALISRFLSNQLNADRVEEMKNLVSEKNINPALLSLLYHFNQYRINHQAE